MFEARLYDGKTASPRAVRVELAADGLVLRDGDAVVATWPIAALRLSARPEDGVSGTLCLGDPGADGPRLAFADPQLGVELRRRNPDIERLPALERRRMARRVALWLAIAAASIFVLLQVVIPAAAEQAARLVPAATERAMGAAIADAVARQLARPEAARDGRAFCTTPEGDAALRDLVARLAAGQGSMPFAVRVVDSPVANALALPGGQVLLLRGLLALADGPDEVAGVLAHEMAHVFLRHPTALALRRAATGFIVGLVFGDVIGISVVGGVAAMLLGAAHTREAEAEADRTALALLQGAAIDGTGLGRVLARMEGERRTAALPGFLETHPPTEERARLAAGAGWPSRPALSDAAWHALRTICDSSPDADRDGQ